MPQIKPKPPCTKECEKRKPGCRSVCEPFIKYDRDRLEYYKETQARKEEYRKMHTIRDWKR